MIDHDGALTLLKSLEAFIAQPLSLKGTTGNSEPQKGQLGRKLNGVWMEESVSHSMANF